MLYDSFFPKQRRVTGAISLVGLCVSAVVLLGMMWAAERSGAGMERNDRSRQSAAELFVRLSARLGDDDPHLDGLGRTEDVPAGEYHALLMFATFGMMLMAAGNDLVVIFLGLETLSIATYVMAGLRKGDLRSNESSMKYFILGSFASAFLLYGMALIYGATGATNIDRRSPQRSADAKLPRPAADRGGDDDHRVWFQDRDGAVSRLDAGRLRRCADAGHGLYGRRAKGGGICIVRSCFCARFSARCRRPGFGLSA